MGLLDCIWMGFSFGIWSGIPLFWPVVPMMDLTMGDVGWFVVKFRPGRGQREIGGGGVLGNILLFLTMPV